MRLTPLLVLPSAHALLMRGRRAAFSVITFLQILANREEEQRDVLADLLDAQRGIGFGRTKSGKIIPPTPDWLGIYLLDEPEDL